VTDIQRVHSPAGAITVLLPMYLHFLGIPHSYFVAPVASLYTIGIAFLMVSRLPVFSGKRVGKHVPHEVVLPVFVIVVLSFALLISYPWEVLTIGTVAYLATLPLGWVSFRNARGKTEAPSVATVPGFSTGPAAIAAEAGERGSQQPSPPIAEQPLPSERATRLN